MKKYVRLSIVTIFFVIMFSLIPMFISSFISEVELTYPYAMRVSNDISVNGSVEEQYKKDVFVDIPVVPDKLYVHVGDKVEAGDMIATVDVQATQAAVFNLVEASNLIPKEYISVMGKINIDEKMVQGYIPTEIFAPASGTITSMTLLPGVMSLPTAAACTISQTDYLRVKMNVSEEDADNVKVGDTVVFKASATASQKYLGKVNKIFPTASKILVGTTQQTVVGLYVDIEDKETRLKPGYSVNGVIKKLTNDKAFVLPYEAILQDEFDNEYVYTYQKGRAVRKYVKTGKELINGVQILDGITEFDIIVKNASDVKEENGLLKIIG